MSGDGADCLGIPVNLTKPVAPRAGCAPVGTEIAAASSVTWEVMICRAAGAYEVDRGCLISRPQGLLGVPWLRSQRPDSLIERQARTAINVSAKARPSGALRWSAPKDQLKTHRVYVATEQHHVIVVNAYSWR